MTNILEKIERVFKPQDIKVKAQVGKIIDLSYSTTNGFKTKGGYIGKHLKLTMDTDGEGKYQLGAHTGKFLIDPMDFKELGALLGVELSEMTGVEIDVSMDAEGQIIVEGEVEREFFGAVKFGVGGTIIFSPIEAMKLLPGVANAMKVSSGKYQDKKNAWYLHCAVDPVEDEAKCRAQFRG
jgi:hypothetical protein